MRVPVGLAEAFGEPFEKLIADFVSEQGLLPESETLQSPRFLARSVVPHVKKLSDLFNRLAPREVNRLAPREAASGPLDPYWKQSSNPAHLRLAYFMSFMPCNLFRIASIWAELSRLGYRFEASAGGATPNAKREASVPRLRGIEFGAGPAAGAAGVAAGERHTPLGLPTNGDWALIERDRATLKLGTEWAQRYFADQGFPEWGTRPFHRTIELTEGKGFLPPNAPKFNVWVMSFFLNEILEREPIERVAELLMDSWESHLEDEAIILLVEPALKLQSRKLLELRRHLIAEATRRKVEWMKILLPCLGHQSCGALAAEGDWCHEEVSWWRPPYIRSIDQLAGLDRKTLPFSYLAIAKSSRSKEELLPALRGSPLTGTQRLVSPSHSEGKEVEFFICGQEGKRRARYRPRNEEDRPERGDILLGAEIRGDVHASRIERITKIAGQEADAR